MEVLLGKVTQQAMNYAIRSGIAITSGYAIRQCSRLLKATDGKGRDELRMLQLRLEGKIRIISPAIDMIELIAARGNTSLESAVALTKELRWDIQSLGTRLARAVAEEDEERTSQSKLKQRPPSADNRLASIILDIKKLLDRIEDAVPLINLAITTSGIKLSTTLPSTVSPSRLLQASTFLSAADTQYALSSATNVQVGPTFTLSLYMLFSGHIHRPQVEDSVRETTWKEAVHKARVKLLRVPLDKIQTLPPFEDDANPLHHSIHDKPDPHNISAEGKAYEFAYQLLLVEDLDDDRVHSYEDDEPQPGPYDEVSLAGIREIIPIHQISKIFYADTGKILNIGTEGETNNPVLLLKRDINAAPPRRMMDQKARDAAEYADFPGYEEEEVFDLPGEEQSEIDAQIHRDSIAGRPSEPQSAQEEAQYHQWRLPPTLDPEWVALEVYFEEQDSETDDDGLSEDFHSTPRSHTPSERQSSLEPGITPAFANLSLRQASLSPSNASGRVSPKQLQSSLSRPRSNGLPNIKTSLSLLEMLIRLTSLQQFQQASHLSITDELLTFFLEESSTTGAGADTEMRKRVRRDARKRVGFDPYDESPIKRRGEDYLYQQADHEYAYDYNEHNGEIGDTGALMSSPSHLKKHSEVRSSPVPTIHAYPYRSPSPRDITPGSVGEGENVHMRRQTLPRREHSSNISNNSVNKIPARIRDTSSSSPEPLSSPPTPLPSLRQSSPRGEGEGQITSIPTTPNQSRSRSRPMALKSEAAGGRRTRSSPLGIMSVINSVEGNDSNSQAAKNSVRNGNRNKSLDEDKFNEGQVNAVKDHDAQKS